MLCLPRDKYLAILYLSKESFSYPKEHFSDYPLPYCAEIVYKLFLKQYEARYKLYCKIPGCVAQSVTCLATDVSLTTDPGVASLIPGWSHTFMEIDIIMK